MRSTPPPVSICLPVFNGEAYLTDAVNSVLSQSYADFELIIVDDRSEDSSMELLQDIIRRTGDRRIRFFQNEERLGLFANYNRCLEFARGQFIKPFAQDDLLHPEYLEICLKHFENNPQVNLVSARRNWIDENGDDATGTYKSPFGADLDLFKNIDGQGGSVEGKLVVAKCLEEIINFIGEPTCVLYRSSNFRVEDSFRFDENFQHLGDLDLWLRVIHQGNMVFEDRTLCSFRRHRGSATYRNLDSFAIAPDLMLLFKKISTFYEEPTRMKKAFLGRALPLMSNQLKYLVGDNEDRLRCHASMKQLSKEDLELIASEALMMLSPESMSLRESQELSERIVQMEKRLRERLDDPFWRATRIFRELNILATRSTGVRSLQRDSGWSQREYLHHLRRELLAVRLSRTFAIKRLLTKVLKIDLIKATTRKDRVSAISSGNLERKLRRLKAASGGRTREAEVEGLINEQLESKTRSNIQPELTVIIGFMRHSPVKALEALARQDLDHNRFEVICVDTSGDKSIWQDLERWSQTESASSLQYRLIRAKSGGRAFANNLGLRLSKSSLVVLLASDFIPPTSLLNKHREFHIGNEKKASIAIGGAKFKGSGGDLDFQKWLDESGTVFGVPFSEAGKMPNHFFYAANTSLRKELIFKAGLFDEDFVGDAWDDYELGLRLSNLGTDSQYLPGVECVHEHPVTLKERIQITESAARAALTFDLKYPGRSPWHDQMERSECKNRYSAAQKRIKYILSRDKKYLQSYWQESLESAFTKAYKEQLKLEQKHHRESLAAVTQT